jgi:DNA-binding transcriptional LysR family regulator
MTNIRNVDLNLLVVFDALFDERSVTRAANRLALTQPTVSGSLKRLRETFSDELFLRTSHGILPTPRAEALATPVKALLANVQTLVTTEAFDPAISEETVRLCGGDYVQHVIFGPLIEAIRKTAPGIKVLASPRPVAGVLSDLFARGEMDIVISARDTLLPDFSSMLLYSERYICVGRKRHPLKAHRISLKQLCTFDHLLVSPSGDRFSNIIDSILAKQNYRRRVASVVPSYPLMFDILDRDDFLVFVPKGLLRERKSDLKIFKTELAVPPVEILASWHPRLNGDGKHKWLRGLLVKVAKAQ